MNKTTAYKVLPIMVLKGLNWIPVGWLVCAKFNPEALR